MKTTHNHNFSRTAALAMVAAFLCLRASAAIVTLSPTADAFVTTGPTSNLSTNNYGGAGALSVAAPNLAQGEFQSVLQFGFAGAKSSFDTQYGVGQWTLQSVTLQLTATAPNNSIFNASAAGQFTLSWMQNDSWTEGTGVPIAPTNNGITFATLSNYVSVADENLGTFGFSGATNGNSTYSLNLTPSFSADVLAGNTVSFRMFAADPTVSDLSDSRSVPSSSLRPVLTVTAVPEPCSFTLGLLSLYLAARFRPVIRSRRE